MCLRGFNRNRRRRRYCDYLHSIALEGSHALTAAAPQPQPPAPAACSGGGKRRDKAGGKSGAKAAQRAAQEAAEEALQRTMAVRAFRTLSKLYI